MTPTVAFHQLRQVVVFVLCLFFGVASTSMPAVSASNLLVDEVCKKSEDYNFCVKALQSDPRTGGADLVGLAQIAIDLTSQKISSTTKDIRVLISVIKDPAVKSLLGACLEEYEHLEGFVVVDVNKDLKENKYQDLMDDAYLVSDQPGYCEDRFKDSTPPAKSPITSQNNNVVLTSNIIVSAALVLMSS